MDFVLLQNERLAPALLGRADLRYGNDRVRKEDLRM